MDTRKVLFVYIWVVSIEEWNIFIAVFSDASLSLSAYLPMHVPTFVAIAIYSYSTKNDV